MSVMSENHQKLDEHGIGKCSVPMWCDGLPAGFCDKDAYGERPESKTWRGADGYERREDGRYAGFVPALACPAHGGPDSRVFKDGSAWCAVYPDFVNIQESHVGFGDTPEAAREELRKDATESVDKTDCPIHGDLGGGNYCPKC